MKNMFKTLGIIVILAIILSVAGCAADPEDQVEITITGIPSGANGNYAYIALISAKKTDLIAHADSNNEISGGKVSSLMLDANNQIFDKEGSYKLAVFIYKDVITDENLNDAYSFYTRSPVAIKKGNNTFDTTNLKNEAEWTMDKIFGSDAAKEAAKFAGTYITTYKTSSNAPSSSSIVETIVLAEDSFVISDNTSSADELKFSIREWDYASTPDVYSDAYPYALSFKGKITESSAGYYGTSSQTGKGITVSDIKKDGSGPDCWMYLYFNDDGKFIRTPFTKSGAAENKTVVLHWTSPAGAPLRVYEKQ